MVLAFCALSMLSVEPTKAQQIAAPNSYANPVQGAAHRFSAVFGEMRTDHFHSGLDFKTDGVEGKRIVAAADGYISRIGIATSGFGICLYVTHPSLGTTTVYAHLSKFRSDIAKHVESERHRQKRSNITLYPTASQFPVKKGDLIGFSGNSGTSSGPHLHYEVREAATQKPLNPVTIGAVKLEDNIAPTIKALYYIETHTAGNVRYEAEPVKIELEKRPSGIYMPVNDANVMVGRSGYFVLGATDRKNHVANTFGLYTLQGFDEGELFYSYKQDGFLFSNTRYVNAMSYYPLQRSSATEYYRMMRQPGVPIFMFDKVLNDGFVMTNTGGESRKIEIVAGDDMGNKSAVMFTIEGKKNGDCLKVAKADMQGEVARHDRDNNFMRGNLRVVIPTGALYSSVHFNGSIVTDELPPIVEGSMNYSALYKVMDYDTPLHKAMEVAITAMIPEDMHDKVVMAQLNRRGARSILNATYNSESGEVIAYTRAMGRFYVATDTEAPTISLNFKNGSNLRSRSSVTITTKDNFSGVTSTEVYINNRWMPIDQIGSQQRVYFNRAADGKRHTIKVVAKDRCGNEKVLTYWYIR